MSSAKEMIAEAKRRAKIDLPCVVCKDRPMREWCLCCLAHDLAVELEKALEQVKWRTSALDIYHRGRDADIDRLKQDRDRLERENKVLLADHEKAAIQVGMVQQENERLRHDFLNYSTHQGDCLGGHSNFMKGKTSSSYPCKCGLKEALAADRDPEKP